MTETTTIEFKWSLEDGTKQLAKDVVEHPEYEDGLIEHNVDRWIGRGEPPVEREDSAKVVVNKVKAVEEDLTDFVDWVADFYEDDGESIHWSLNQMLGKVTKQLKELNPNGHWSVQELNRRGRIFRDFSFSARTAKTFLKKLGMDIDEDCPSSIDFEIVVNPDKTLEVWVYNDHYQVFCKPVLDPASS